MLNQQTALDSVFRALSDVTRRAIVERLTSGPVSVSLLAEPLDMSLPAVMQHLQVLEDSGLVRSVKVGRTRTCRIEPKTLALAERWITDRRLFWEANLDRLGAFLAAEPEGPREPTKKPHKPQRRKKP
jgi:DNA-binding transcriptional ArsR family regulator